MKKTLTINLSGTVFHIDEDAFEKLSTYFHNINRHFGSDADAKEIVEDIEARISELFTEKIKSGDEVINISHVDEVIVIMGTPESFLSEDTSDEPIKKRTRSKGKKLYRDPDDRVLGGVCSGLGNYFAMDPVIFRILFVLVFFFPIGSSVLIYLILWLVVPKARNTAQRLEMKGEEVNINNISKTIKEEIQDVKDNYKNFRSNSSYIKGRESVNEVGKVIGSVLRAILKIAFVFFGVIFLIVGVVALIALLGSLFVSHEMFGIMPFNKGFEYLDLFFVHGALINWIWVGVALVVGVPLIMMVYLGIKMIFKIKTGNYIIGSVASGCFLFGILILLFAGTKALSEFKSTSTTNNNEIIQTKSDTLFLTMGVDEFKEYVDPNINFNTMRIASVNGKEFLLGTPRLNIERCESNEFSIIVKNQSRGLNLERAQQNARSMKYKYLIKDSLVTFQPAFILPENSSWRNQEVTLTLRVPTGKTVYLGKEMEEIIHDIENSSDTWDDEMVGKYWTMKNEGLSIAQRAVPKQSTKNSKK